MPTTKPLLIAITNVECSNLEGLSLLLGATDAARTACARQIMGSAVLSSLRLTLDGVLVKDLDDFRFVSPPSVTFVAMESPWEIEPELVPARNLPLNLAMNINHSFYARLSTARREARRAALASKPRATGDLTA